MQITLLRYTLILALFCPISLISNNIDDIPPSVAFGYRNVDMVYELVNSKELYKPGSKYEPLQAGNILKVNDNYIWDIDYYKNKTIGRVQFYVPGAKALNVYLDNIHLDIGDVIYVYNPAVKEVFSYDQSSNKIVSDFVSGNMIIVEYYTDKNIKEIPLTIKEVGLLINDYRGFGDAGSCEVHINCQEGENWQNQKQGVARILVRDGSTTFWCTGSLINNTNNDRRPFFLTANHCGQNSDSTDYSEWMFYFNFEAPSCGDPPLEPGYDLITGSFLRANSKSGTSSSSDFKLLELSTEINPSYKPYYNGWDRRGNSSNSGVTIHHPQGDIKMISTYTVPLKSTGYDSDIENPDGRYWRVVWSETTSGHGVTEGGSSGSPLFNDNGLIIGALTGGRASCTYLDEPDFYGKFSSSWDDIISDSTTNLSYWLDPKQSGAQTLMGSNFDSTVVYAGFSAEKTTITVGESVEFINTSFGNITSHKWTFEGGDPGTSELENPGDIVYNSAGSFGVRLIVSSADAIDTLYIQNYITVLPNISPNPSSTGIFKISFGDEIPENYDLNVFDVTGRQISFNIKETGSSYILVSIANKYAGLYLLKLKIEDKVKSYKVILSD